MEISERNIERERKKERERVRERETPRFNLAAK